MEEFGLLIDLGIALAAASVAGIAVAYLRQPVVLGYLIAGILIGPHALGFVTAPESVEIIAEIGVILLLFVVGIEFSLSGLKSLKGVALWGGILQITLTAAFGTGLGLIFGWTLNASIFFGALIALSSTMVVLKLLTERGELDSVWGRIVLGILIIQDISLVPLIVILPSLAQPIEVLLPQLGLAIVKAAAFLVGMFFVGTRILPWIMAKVAVFRSRELFLLVTLTLALSTAFATYAAGLSLALGAFIAGVVVSESDFRHQIVGEVSSLRDVFAALFFTSIGMLFQPQFFLENWALVIMVVILVSFGKTVITSAIPLFFGFVGRVLPFIGLALFQMGEFSFVLAQTGVNAGILTGFEYQLFLVVAIITIMLTPLGLNLAPRVAELIQRSPIRINGFGGKTGMLITPNPEQEELSGHAVICGMGQTGRNLAAILERRGFKYIVVDLDPRVMEYLKERGVPAVYGDAANEHVLSLVGLERARIMIVNMPDMMAAACAVQYAHRVNRRLDIIVKARRPSDVHHLKQLGARAVIVSNFEGGLEILRHTLVRFGLTSFEAQAIAQRLRAETEEPEEA